MSAAAKIVGELIQDFIAYSFEHGGTDITDEAMRIARALAGEDPNRLAAWLLDEVLMSLAEYVSSHVRS